jgi:hypothetical protein
MKADYIIRAHSWRTIDVEIWLEPMNVAANTMSYQIDKKGKKKKKKNQLHEERFSRKHLRETNNLSYISGFSIIIIQT